MQRISCFWAAALAAGTLQAAPLNEATRAHYADISEQMQAYLPLPANGFITVIKAALEKDQWHVDYRLPQAETLAQTLTPGKPSSRVQAEQMMSGILQSMKAGTLQEYYLETCQSPPPLQPIAINYRVFDSKNKLLAKWQAQPRECRSEAAKKAQARGTMAFESSMIADNVRLDEGGVKNGHMFARYTLTDQDFSQIHPDALLYVHSQMKQLLLPMACSPQGGLMPGILSAQFAMQDKHGRALPPVDISAVDCAPTMATQK